MLLGGALGAACAILSIEFFDTTAMQLGYVAACAIFGGTASAVISAGIPQGARKFTSWTVSKNLRTARQPESKSPLPKELIRLIQRRSRRDAALVE